MADPHVPAAPGSDAAEGAVGGTALLHGTLGAVAEVLASLDRRVAAVEAALADRAEDQATVAALRAALDRMDAVSRVEADLAAVRAALVDHPAARLQETVDRIGAKVDAFVAQPGPGPALAMVAAGLAERFEIRTQALVELIEQESAFARTLGVAIEGSMESLVAFVEGRQAGLDTLLDTVRSLAVGVERIGLRVEVAGERATAGGPPRTVAPDDGLATELGRQAAELGRVVESARAVMAALDVAGATAETRGGRAGRAGRRLAADLGIMVRAKPAPDDSRREPGRGSQGQH